MIAITKLELRLEELASIIFSRDICNQTLIFFTPNIVVFGHRAHDELIEFRDCVEVLSLWVLFSKLIKIIHAVIIEKIVIERDNLRVEQLIVDLILHHSKCSAQKHEGHMDQELGGKRAIYPIARDGIQNDGTDQWHLAFGVIMDRALVLVKCEPIFSQNS